MIIIVVALVEGIIQEDILSVIGLYLWVVPVSAIVISLLFALFKLYRDNREWILKILFIVEEAVNYLPETALGSTIATMVCSVMFFQNHPQMDGLLDVYSVMPSMQGSGPEGVIVVGLIWAIYLLISNICGTIAGAIMKNKIDNLESRKIEP